MAHVRFSRQARADLLNVLDYLSDNAGARVARRFNRDVRALERRWRSYPGIGAPRPEFGPVTRMSVISPYLLFYDGGPDSGDVVVLRVLDGRRDLTAEIIGRGRNR